MFSLSFQLFEFIFPASNYNREENLCKVERLYGLKYDNESCGQEEMTPGSKARALRLYCVFDALKQSELEVAQSQHRRCCVVWCSDLRQR